MSLERENNKYDDMISQGLKNKKRIKVTSSKSIQEEAMSIVYISGVHTHKYRNRRLNDNLNSNINFFSKAINKSCAIHSVYEKDEIRHINNKEDENSLGKKKNLIINSVIGKHIDLTSIIYASLLKYNNNLHSNSNHKRRNSVEEKKGSNTSCPYTRRGKRNRSLTRGEFNYSELYKDKAMKNSSMTSIFSIKYKQQCL